ncbi:MAG: hypothetical protein GY731_19025 [Gammaproteobacteria bacterium]|nr:hypothetical protein [Gammaproteobacteria bacterium]
MTPSIPVNINRVWATPLFPPLFPLGEVKTVLPDRYAKLENEYAKLLEKQIKSLERNDILTAHELLASARKALPDNLVIGGIKLTPIQKP